MTKSLKKAETDLFGENSESSNLVLGTKKSNNTHHNARFSGADAKPGVNRVKANAYRKRFMMRQLPYKLPSICRCKSGEWYVQFGYEYPDQPGKFKPFKVKDGINRIHDLKEKEKQVQQLAADITYWLEVLNYNPFEGKTSRLRQIEKETKKKSLPEHWTLTEAIAEYRKFINKQNYSDRTVQTYNNYLYNIEGYLKDFPDKNISASIFTEYDLIEFLDVENDELEWSARTYNNYLDFYGSFFNRCKKLEKARIRTIQYDFDKAGLEFKKDDPQKNKAYTGIIADAVKKELLAPEHINLRDYIEWMYLSAMRPKEIRALKVMHIDEVNRQIRIIGKETRPNSKRKHGRNAGKTGDRIIPISDQLMKLIKKRGVMECGLNSYVFGYAGRISADRVSKDYFPSKYILIKQKLGLDHNYTPYGWKHTGVIAMVKAGFKDEEIMVLTGHKTREAFEAYKRDLVIDNTHVMKGSTVEFWS